jgi:hypothetical protein
MKRKSLVSIVGIVAAALLAVVLLTGCISSSDDNGGIPAADSSGAGAATSTTTTPDGQAYADCIRGHGIAISDPDPETGLPAFDDSVDMSSAAVQSALDDCQEFLPAGVRGEAEEQDLDTYVAFAECMRENGLPNFPDPQPGSEGGMFGGAEVDRSDPTFQKATEACGDVLSGEGN